MHFLSAVAVKHNVFPYSGVISAKQEGVWMRNLICNRRCQSERAESENRF